MLYKPITVDVDVLARVMRVHGLGEPHITLAAGAAWVDPDTDNAADQAALRSFSELGMANGAGLHADLVDSLAVLVRPATEFYGWFTHRDATTAVLAASIGADAVLALRRGNRIRLMPVDSVRLAEAIVGCLPNVPPGRGHSINVARSRMRTAIAVPAGQEAVSEHSSGAAEMAFARLRALPATGAGELHVAIRNRITQRRSAAPCSVGYQDTVEGRWWMQVVPGHDDEWIVAAPATADLLVTRLYDAYRALCR